MKYGFMMGPILLVALLSAPPLFAFSPYIQLETGISSRDVVEDVEVVIDGEVVGHKVKGDAVSTQIIAKAGIELWRVLSIYALGGGTTLSIDEFDGFDSRLQGLYGGGVRLNFYNSPHRDQLTLYVEGEALRFSADDHVVALVVCSAGNGCSADTGLGIETNFKETIDWNEYTIRIGGSGNLGGIRGYGGIRLSQVDGTDKLKASPNTDFPGGVSETLDLEEDDNFGIFFGLDLFLDRSEKSSVYFDISIIDRDSFKVGIRRSF